MELKATTCEDGGVIDWIDVPEQHQHVVEVQMFPGKGKGSKEMAATLPADVSPPSAATSAAYASPSSSVTSSPAAATPSGSRSTPNAIKEVLNLSFPRCSCCGTGWYDAIAEDKADHSDLDTKQPAAGNDRKRKRHHDRPSHRNLFPMPKCGCTTRLALPELPPSIFSEKECKDPLEVLSQVQTHSFPNLAICKPCLKHRIDASKEVTEHDYRQEHIPNGQRNVKFTVEPDCVQCKRKFMVRVLERLLENEGGDDPKRNSWGTSRKKKGRPEAIWQDAVEATIQLVGWAKRDNRRERKMMRQHRRASKMNQSLEADLSDQNDNWWEKHDGFTGGDSSDECYSLSSDSGDEWESEDEPTPTKGPHRLALKSGELLEDLLHKDPKFRQEKEDEQYVKKFRASEARAREMMKKEEIERQWASEARAREIMEEEETERQRARETRAREDHELALKLQEEEDKKKSSNKFTPVKTRSKKKPILDAWKKASSASAKKSDREQSSTEKPIIKASKQNPIIHLDGDDSSVSSTASHCAKASPGVASMSSTPNANNFTETSNPELQASSTSTSADAAPTNDTSTEDGVDEIVVMGFTEASAQRCLKDAGGNVQLAISMLLSEATDS